MISDFTTIAITANYDNNNVSYFKLLIIWIIKTDIALYLNSAAPLKSSSCTAF